MSDEIIIESMFNCVPKDSSHEGSYEMFITTDGSVAINDYQGNERFTYPNRGAAEKDWVIF